ncbi:MAG TPA: RNA polymerase factor sigma-54 [Phycisphaerae bacterium]|nr:RNA polymerase factor sigma-54 [Phycisphaerae bacterium]
MSQQLSLGLRQEQRLTPQLIQSMNILQLPLMALEAKVREELERNPALEDGDMDGPVTPDESDKFEQADLEPSPESRELLEGFTRLDQISREYGIDDSDHIFGRPRQGAGERDAKMDAMANTASRPESLNEYLVRQWAFVEIEDERVREAGELIINYIEDDGYLRTPLAEIAEQHVPPFSMDEMEEALSWIQSLEPAGVGARDLKECLLIQLDALAEEEDVELERLLVENHLADIEKNRYPVIAKATGRTIEEIKAAMHNLARLHPHPGRLVGGREVPRVTPDVIVDYADDGDGYTVRLARGNSPRLRISETYRRMLQECRDNKEARDFVRKNLESAGALIDAIAYRRNRLLEVAEEVVKRQRDFLDLGPTGLKVLRMSELAEKLGCDPSTISRTVADKYVQTPRGIFPLRYFFTGGTEASDGEATSWDSVKARVQSIIESEDKKNPLSDEVIAARLQAEGIDVSRRTIAKYRKQLHIPAARQRREF